MGSIAIISLTHCSVHFSRSWVAPSVTVEKKPMTFKWAIEASPRTTIESQFATGLPTFLQQYLSLKSFLGVGSLFPIPNVDSKRGHDKSSQHKLCMSEPVTLNTDPWIKSLKGRGRHFAHALTRCSSKEPEIDCPWISVFSLVQN